MLDEGWSVLKAGTERVRSQARTPDEAQLELYHLAFGYSCLKACEALIEYRSECWNQADSTSRELVDGIVSLFLAESVYETTNQLSVLLPSANLGLSVDVRRLIGKILSANYQEQLGQILCDSSDPSVPELLGDEVRAMRDSLRRVTDEHIQPMAQRIHLEDLTVPDALVQVVAEMGCFGLSVPSTYGGSKEQAEKDTVAMAVVTEELSRGSLGAAGSLITRPEILVSALLEGGTEKQKQRWLPGVASGNPLCAISVTEPNTGSDVASIMLRATPRENGWLLNGTKTWCTLAGQAGLILVLARTDSQVKPPHRGLSLFVVEKPATDSHSFEITSPGGGTLSGYSISTLGYRGMHSFEMHYDDFYVPHSSLVGENQGVNRGFYYTMKGFSAGRLQTAARAVGLMQAAYEAALAHSRNRFVFGRPLASFPLTLVKLGRMMMHITAIRQFAYAVARRMETATGQIEASLVKLLACRSAEWVTREAVQLHGGMGYAEETPVSRFFVDARVLSIFEGAEETLAIRVVGKALLEGILD